MNFVRRFCLQQMQVSAFTPSNSPPSLFTAPPLWVLLIEADCTPHRCLPGSGCGLNMLWHPCYRSCLHSLIHSESCQPGLWDRASRVKLGWVLHGNKKYRLCHNTALSYLIFRMFHLVWLAVATPSAESQKRVSKQNFNTGTPNIPSFPRCSSCWANVSSMNKCRFQPTVA